MKASAISAGSRVSAKRKKGTAQTADYTAVLLPGSGTYSVEAMLSATVPPEGKLLIISNGAYGRRLEQIARVHHLATHVLSYPEDCPAKASDVDAADTAAQFIEKNFCLRIYIGCLFCFERK